MIRKNLKTRMSLPIIIAMLTSLVFNTGITASAAELDENIVFESSAEDEFYQTSADTENTNQEPSESDSHDLPETIIFSDDSDSSMPLDSDDTDSEADTSYTDDYSGANSTTDTTLLDSEDTPIDTPEKDSEIIPDDDVSFEITDSTKNKADTANTVLETPEYLEIVEEIIEPLEPETFLAEDLPDEEELFAQYVDREFGVDYYEAEESSTANARRGAPARNYLNTDEKKFYDKALELITGVSNGTLTTSEHSYSPSEIEIEYIQAIEVEDLYDCTKTASGWSAIVNSSKFNAAAQELTNQLLIDSNKVFNALRSDYPALLYWFGREYQIGIGSYSISSNGNQVKTASAGSTTGTVDGFVSVATFKVYFSVSSSYAVFKEGSTTTYYPDQPDTTKTSATSTAVANAQAIAASYSNLGDYEKLLAFKEKICSLVTYNRLAAMNSISSMGSDPWELIYVFDNDPETNVVCEGYSKAFQYLCDISTFTNDTGVISVTGTMDGGGHEWNIVQFDGKNYLIDVTNCDNDDIEGGNTSLFMVGYKSDSVNNGYVIYQKSFDYPDGRSSIPQDITYVYDYDTLNLYSGRESLLALSNTDYEAGTENEIEITQQPTDVTVGEGKSARFSVTASGSDLSYLWQYKNAGSDTWVNWTSKRTASISVAYNASRNGMSLRCVITDGNGTSKTSDIAILSYATIEILSQPRDITVADGKSARFSVSASGSDLTYLWQYKNANSDNWVDWTSKRTASISVAYNASRNGMCVRCLITDSYGNSKTSDEAVLFYATIEILTQPQDTTVAEGKPAYFSVSATGSDLTYLWQYKKANASKWVDWTSKRTASISVAYDSARNGMSVRCLITDSNGISKTSDIAILSYASIEILNQPQDTTVAEGKPAYFSVTATGSDLTYLWQYKKAGASKWVDWTSKRTASISVAYDSTRNGMSVRCVITDGFNNSETSDIAVLSYTSIEIMTQPQDTTVAEDKPAYFSVSATGSNLTYLWQYKKVGATKWVDWTSKRTASISVAYDATRNGMNLRCVITDDNGFSKTSDIAILSYASIEILNQPQDTTVAEGKPAYFSITATGSDLTYLWQYKKASASKWVDWTSKRTASISVAYDASRNGMNVRCVITDSNGISKTSNIAILSYASIEILNQPQDTIVAEGKPAYFSVTATGSDLTYLWQYKKANASKWVDWTSKRTASISVAYDASRNGMNLRCVINDRNGISKTTDIAILSYASIEISNQPQDTTVAEGKPAYFSITATGSDLTYLWQYKKADSTKWVNWTSKTTSSISVAYNTSRNGMKLRCVITDGYGTSSISDEATLTYITCLHTGNINGHAISSYYINVKKATSTEFGRTEKRCDYCDTVLDAYEYKAFEVSFSNGETEIIYGYLDHDYAMEVWDLTNEYRKENGLNELLYNESAQEFSDLRVIEAAADFSHTRPNGAHWNTVTEKWKYGGENLAGGQENPERVLEAWKNSEGHDKNLKYGINEGETPYVGLSVGCLHTYTFDKTTGRPFEYIFWGQHFTFIDADTQSYD